METDTPARITLAQAREAIRLLTAHPASGYEWECNGCYELQHPYNGSYRATVTQAEWDAISAQCPHQRQGDDPISRLDVLAILDRVSA